MATTTTNTAKELVHYRVEEGICILELDDPPANTYSIKRAVVTGSEMGFGEALGLERELQQLLLTSEDAREGLAAYLEKRPPKFKGK